MRTVRVLPTRGGATSESDAGHHGNWTCHTTWFISESNMAIVAGRPIYFRSRESSEHKRHGSSERAGGNLRARSDCADRMVARGNLIDRADHRHQQGPDRNMVERKP